MKRFLPSYVYKESLKELHTDDIGRKYRFESKVPEVIYFFKHNLCLKRLVHTDPQESTSFFSKALS